MRTDSVPAFRAWMLAPPALLGALIALSQLGAFDDTGASTGSRRDDVAATVEAGPDAGSAAARTGAVAVVPAAVATPPPDVVVDVGTGTDSEAAAEIAALQRAQSAELAAD